MMKKADFTAGFWNKTEKRFWSKSKADGNGCWIWTGAKDKDGYGKFTHNSKSYRAPRFAYMLANGEVPDNLHVCHSCDKPSCVNPAHLWLGDDKANARDRDRKGRGFW